MFAGFPEGAMSTVRRTAALTLLFMSGWLLNQYLFPAYDVAYLHLRDIAIGAFGLVFVALALMASRTSAPFISRHPGFPIAAIIVCGWALLAFGTASAQPPLIIIGAFCTSIATGFVYVTVCISCLDMGLPKMGMLIAVSLVLAAFLRFVIQLAPGMFVFHAYFVFHLLILVILRHDVDDGSTAIARAGSVRDAQLVQPSSFLPFGSQVFICMFVFRCVFGVALTYGEVDRIPVDTNMEAVFVLIAALYVLARYRRRQTFDVDLVFRIASLFVLAGFLCVLLGDQVPTGVANSLLYSGSSLFDLVAWYVIIAIASRNHLGAVSVFSWGMAMIALGVVAGANIGRLLDGGIFGNVAVEMLFVCVVLAFMAYIIYLVSHQRFAEAIEEVTPLERIEVIAEQPAFEANCAIVAQRYDLTARELDVLALLARGRNGHYIQEKLCISYNTVKTHVFHIYSKLGVHTQQEIIDLVESSHG